MITNTTIGLEEAIETFTGYEEQAVEQRFGAPLGDLLEGKPTAGMRAVAMVLVGRDLEAQEIKDAKGKAYKHVMEMTLRQVNDFFPEVDDEPVPDEPVTEQGKGDSQPG